jgi:hypothetical protein
VRMARARSVYGRVLAVQLFVCRRRADVKQLHNAV